MGYTPSETPRIDDFSALLNSSGGSSTAGLVSAIITRAKEMVKDGALKMPRNASVEFIDYPGTTAGYKLDAAVIALTYDLGHGAATTHAMVMVPALSRDEMTVTTEVGRRTYKFTAVPYDMFAVERASRRDRDRNADDEVAVGTNSYAEGLANYLASRIEGVGEVKVKGFVTIPYGYKPKEEDINRLIVKSVDDLKQSIYEELTEGQSFDRNRVVDSEEVLNGQVVYAPEDGLDMFENPIRRNLHLKITKSRRSNRDNDNRNLLSSNTSAELGTLDAFVDYLPLDELSDRRRRRSKSRKSDEFKGCYGLSLNITQLNSGGFNMLEVQQMVLQSAVAMVQEPVLIRAMYPIGTAQTLRTAEALNVETEDYDFGFEAKPSLEEWDDMNEIVLVEDELHVTLFIERGGLLSRVQQTFRDACDPSDKAAYRKAFDALVSAADRATDNNFSESFDASRDEIGYLLPRIVPLGTFTDSNGQQRDLREVDRFFIMSELGLRKRDKAALRIFDRICNDPSMDDEERRERTEAVLDAALGRNNYVVTSFADVVELSPAYLTGLADGYNAVDLSIATDGIDEQDDREYYYQRREGYGTRGFDDQRRYYQPRSNRRDRDDRDRRDRY